MSDAIVNWGAIVHKNVMARRCRKRRYNDIVVIRTKDVVVITTKGGRRE